MVMNPEGPQPSFEVDAAEFEAAQRDPLVQGTLRAARAYGRKLTEEGRHDVTVIDYDEFIEDSKDPEWQEMLQAAQEHLEHLRREGRSE